MEHERTNKFPSLFAGSVHHLRARAKFRSPPRETEGSLGGVRRSQTVGKRSWIRRIDVSVWIRANAKDSRVLSTRRSASVYKRRITPRDVTRETLIAEYIYIYIYPGGVLTHHFDLVYLRDVSPGRRSDRLAHIFPAVLPLHVQDPQAAVAIQGDSLGRWQLLLEAVGQEDLLSPPSHPSLRAYAGRNNNLFSVHLNRSLPKDRHSDPTHVVFLLPTNKGRRNEPR